MSITVASVVVYRISLDFSPTNTHIGFQKLFEILEKSLNRILNGF